MPRIRIALHYSQLTADYFAGAITRLSFFLVCSVHFNQSRLVNITAKRILDSR